MHLCVVPICVADTAVRNIKEVPSNANHRKPKTPVTILLLLKTALTRSKNKAGVAENAIIKNDAEMYINLWQSLSGAATAVLTSRHLQGHKSALT
jgi:hypothetical protein